MKSIPDCSNENQLEKVNKETTDIFKNIKQISLSKFE